jgi:hypothetical protein
MFELIQSYECAYRLYLIISSLCSQHLCSERREYIIKMSHGGIGRSIGMVNAIPT